MGKMQRRKGNDFEREIVHELKHHGIESIRVPLSGGGAIKGDVLIRMPNESQIKVECKIRKSINNMFYEITEPEVADLAAVRQDRYPTLWVMRTPLLCDLLHYKLQAKGS